MLHLSLCFNVQCFRSQNQTIAFLISLKIDYKQKMERTTTRKKEKLNKRNSFLGNGRES